MEEENVVLQVILHGEKGLEIRVGNDNKINPLTLVGILEQVKMNILDSQSTMEQEPGLGDSVKTEYDA
jgi:hypothetical protein